jgi:phospholipase/carboxylesterase
MLEYAQQRLGELDCHLLAGTTTPTRGLVLCHGFGAPGTDLVPIGEELCHLAPELQDSTLFVFPQAPLTPPEFRPYGGRAWWPLDMQRLQAAIQYGEFRDLRKDAPERLPAARDELTSVLAALEQQFGLALDRVLLGGFSQGSMLATDVALHLPSPPAGLIVYSGTLLNEAEWTRLAPHRRGLAVLQTHGTSDPILPFAAAEWLRDLLSAAGLNVEFQNFRGGHTISPQGLASTAERLLGIA